MREVTDLLCKHSAEPNTLPPASEAVICDAKVRGSSQFALLQSAAAIVGAPFFVSKSSRAVKSILLGCNEREGKRDDLGAM